MKAELLNAEKTFADKTEAQHVVVNSLLDRLRENEHALSQSEQRNKQMHLELDGKTYALDQACATIDFLKEELAARAEETDAQGKKTREAQRELLDTLHHGLQWMWKSKGLAKQSKKLRELLRAAHNSGLFKDAEIKRLREELDKLGEHKDSSKVPGFITNLLGLFVSSAMRGRKSV